MVRMDWLERIGSGVEMVWKSLRQDHALHWSATVLLDASVDVLVAFLVLVCTVLNFFTSSFIRVSGFHIPCSCCVHFRKDSSVIAAEASQNLSFLPAPKSIAAAVVSEVRLNGADFSSEYLRDGDLKSTNSSLIHASRQGILCECPLEVLAEKDGADSECASDLRYEQVNKGFNDRSQEDVDREHYAKAQELLRALHLERETMAALYSELEQERNSSATAASEALAMISRLQEEKAAVQMESWQFQRMVMEKAMYDQEVIEVLKEILAKQEEERLDLEEEVRLYKERLDEVFMEERDSAERTGRDYVPLHLLEGTSTEGNSTSPKSERGELLVSERMSKGERITPDGKLVKEEKIIPNGRPSKEERITPNGRLEDAEFLDRLSKTKSQLLTALLQEGFPEPASSFVEDSASFANEVQKAMAKIPVRAESLPILDHEHYKAALGLGSIKTGRETGLPIPSAVAKKQTEKASGKDTVKSAHEPVSVSREPTPPIIDERKTDKARKAKDSGEVADKSVFVNHEPRSPTIAEKTEKARAVKNGGKSDEPVIVSREIGLPIPPAAAKKQTEKTFVVKDAGKFTDKSLIISREVSLPILPSTVTKKQTEKALVRDDGKAAGEPEFVSLKRRWSSRGTQEVSVEILAKAKEDRRMEEKRLSVLEYVRNLEEQLQQQAGRPAPQLARARSDDGREEEVRFKSPDQYENSSVSAMSVSSGELERDESVQRRLFAHGDSVDKEPNMNSFQGGGDGKLYAQQCSINWESDGKVSKDEGSFYVNAGTSEGSADEVVHDVYEVSHEAGN